MTTKGRITLNGLEYYLEGVKDSLQGTINLQMSEDTFIMSVIDLINKEDNSEIDIDTQHKLMNQIDDIRYLVSDKFSSDVLDQKLNDLKYYVATCQTATFS
ncbi:MAG: hypothetical protein ATN35_11485 [Epulopiscium sp. Nele67-Bin004]|nr:MAG: hypothetical protein ATN35_11485 [Epulopiscium sp. Nele67-Bin004]